MSFQVDTALVQSYKSNIEIQFQQMGSRLRRAVRQESQHAEFDFYDRIGPTDAIEVTSRHSDTPLVSTTHDRRRVALRDFDWADLIDRKDRIRMLADPTSPYVRNAVMALGRRQDDLIIEAASGIAFSGKTGATQIPLPVASKIVVNATKLTVVKLRDTRELLDAAEAAEDGERLYIAVSASQINGLLGDPNITSIDFNTVRALVNGEINSFMGFEFIRTQRLAVDGNGDELCLAWAQNGITLAMGLEIAVDVGPRRDKRNSVQVSMSGGASRMWEEKVIEIACNP